MIRLREFSVVMVSPPFRGRLLRDDSIHCHVLAVVGDTAALEPLDRAATLWLPERLDDVLLSFRHSDEGSLVGLNGSLWQQQGVGNFRFTVTDGVRAAGRRATRIDVVAPITLRRRGERVDVEGHTVNLSANGILVEGELDCALGDAVEFSLALPGVAEPIEATAAVARLADGGPALEIDASHRAVRSRLARFVVDHNRAVLRRRHPVVERELDF